MTDLFKQMILIQTQYCKDRNIKLSEEAEKVYNEASDEQKCEAQISLIEAQFTLDSLKIDNRLKFNEMEGEKL